ncbi:MAG: motif putative anchor domain protein, partial [Gemmatimonadetes bacterium]|nr:motif putative anchor domain protein [Gemmatimonadota bacterium]
MRLSRLSLLALVAAAPSAPLAAQTLSPYGVFVYNDFFHSYSETNGRLAVGGNAVLNHWGVAQFLPASQYNEFTMVVNGNVNANEGSVFHGKTYVGGTITA